MIPIIEKVIESCEIKDNLSEIGLLAGLTVAIHGIYKAVKSTDEEIRNSSITAAAVGGIFMIGSLSLKNTSCKYSYKNEN